MRKNRAHSPQPVHGVHAPASRFTLPAALLVALGMSSALLIVMAGFTVAMTMIWPG